MVIFWHYCIQGLHEIRCQCTNTAMAFKYMKMYLVGWLMCVQSWCQAHKRSSLTGEVKSLLWKAKAGIVGLICAIMYSIKTPKIFDKYLAKIWLFWKSETLEQYPAWTTKEKEESRPFLWEVTQSTLCFTKAHYSVHTSQQTDYTLCSPALRPQQGSVKDQNLKEQDIKVYIHSSTTLSPSDLYQYLLYL